MYESTVPKYQDGDYRRLSTLTDTYPYFLRGLVDLLKVQIDVNSLDYFKTCLFEYEQYVEKTSKISGLEIQEIHQNLEKYKWFIWFGFQDFDKEPSAFLDELFNSIQEMFNKNKFFKVEMSELDINPNYLMGLLYGSFCCGFTQDKVWDVFPEPLVYSGSDLNLDKVRLAKNYLEKVYLSLVTAKLKLIDSLLRTSDSGDKVKSELNQFSELIEISDLISKLEQIDDPNYERAYMEEENIFELISNLVSTNLYFDNRLSELWAIWSSIKYDEKEEERQKIHKMISETNDRADYNNPGSHLCEICGERPCMCSDPFKIGSDY